MTTSLTDTRTVVIPIPVGQPPVLDGRQRWILPTEVRIEYARATPDSEYLTDWTVAVAVAGQLANVKVTNKKPIQVTYGEDLPDWVADLVAQYHPAKTD